LQNARRFYLSKHARLRAMKVNLLNPLQSLSSTKSLCCKKYLLQYISFIYAKIFLFYKIIVQNLTDCNKSKTRQNTYQTTN